MKWKIEKQSHTSDPLVSIPNINDDAEGSAQIDNPTCNKHTDMGTKRIILILFSIIALIVSSNNQAWAQLTASLYVVDNSCFGACNGQAWVTPSGGRPPYTFSWSNGEVRDTITGLCVGNYRVTVTDSLGNTTVLNRNVGQPTALAIYTTPTHHGSCTDTISATVFGGTSPYTYLWFKNGANTGVTTSYLPSVCVSDYDSLRVTDFLGCAASWTGTFSASSSVLSYTVQSTQVSCNGACNGTILITPSGGTPPFSYAWNTSATTSFINGLCPGIYRVTLTDAGGGTLFINDTITEPQPIAASITTTYHGNCNDTLSAAVSGGIAPYTYHWNIASNTSSSLDSACLGQSYAVTVTDAHGCTTTGSYALPAPGVAECISFDDVAVPTANVQQAFNIYGNGHPGFLSAWHVPSGTPSILRSGDIAGLNAYDGNQYALMAVCNSGTNQSEGLELAYNFIAGTTYKVSLAIRNTHEVGQGSAAVDIKFILLHDTINYIYNNNTGCSTTPVIPTGALIVDSSITNYLDSNWSIHSFTIRGLTQNYSQLWIRGAFTGGVASPNTADISIDSMCVQPLTSNVWPGDANNDGLANNFDILTLGQGYLHTGISRVNASLVWVGQPALDWTNNIPGGQNEKYADCDGNGIINADDTLAITLNYGLTHAKTGSEAGSANPLLYIHFPISYYIPAGQAVHVPIYLGNSQVPVAAIYGIAFTVHYDTTLVKSNTADLSSTNSWIGARGTNMLTFRKDLYINAKTDVALVRTNQLNTSGNGQICSVTYVMKDDISGKDEIIKAFTPKLSDVRAILMDGTIIPISLDAPIDTAWITQYTGIDPITPGAMQLNLYPNPAGQYIIVDPGNITVDQYTITDLLGHITKVVRNCYGATNIDISSLTPGIYFLRAQTGNDVTMKKFSIVK